MDRRIYQTHSIFYLVSKMITTILTLVNFDLYYYSQRVVELF